MVDDKDTVTNKTSVSYKTMISNKTLDSFFEEKEEKEPK
jgi:hypothetical protein